MKDPDHIKRLIRVLEKSVNRKPGEKGSPSTAQRKEDKRLIEQLKSQLNENDQD